VHFNVNDGTISNDFSYWINLKSFVELEWVGNNIKGGKNENLFQEPRIKASSSSSQVFKSRAKDCKNHTRKYKTNNGGKQATTLNKKPRFNPMVPLGAMLDYAKHIKLVILKCSRKFTVTDVHVLLPNKLNLSQAFCYYGDMSFQGRKHDPLADGKHRIN